MFHEIIFYVKICNISHSKKTECKICKLDIDNYYDSANYMKEKIYKNFKDKLIEKIKKKFKNHNHMEIFDSILNNSKNKRIIKFKRYMMKNKDCHS